MAANTNLQSYMQSIWDLIHHSARRSGTITDDEIRAKVDEAKTTVLGIIKDMENSGQEETRNVTTTTSGSTLLPLQSNSVSSSSDHVDSTEKPELARNEEVSEESSEDDSDSDDGSDDTENNRASPSNGSSPENQMLNGPGNFSWDENNAARFYDDYAKYVNNREPNQSLRHLYQLYFWLDFLSSGYNGNGQNFRYV